MPSAHVRGDVGSSARWRAIDGIVVLLYPAYNLLVPGNRPGFLSEPATSADALSRYLSGLRFVVNRYGHQHDDPRAEADARVIGDVELIYVRGGRSRISIGDDDLLCGAGDLVIIPPFAVHEIRTREDAPHDNYWVHFDVVPLYERDRFLQLLPLGRLALSSTPCGPFVADAFELFGRTIEACDGRGKTAVLEGLLQSICGLLASALPRVEDGPTAGAVDGRGPLQRTGSGVTSPLPPSLSGDDRSVLDRVIHHVESNLSEEIDVDALVAGAQCSRSRLFTVFQEQFGRSPMSFVRWMRLRQTERLLRNTNMSVKEISAAVGVASPFHLSRLFKELYGVSPQQFRTQAHELWTS